MLILWPKSAFATILVTLNPSNLIFLLVNFLISFEIFWAAKQASSSDSDPMIIILPDLKIKIVLLGLVFLSITAGNLFLLQRDPDTFQAISFNQSSAFPSVLPQGSNRANDTTFCTAGSTLAFDIFFIIFQYHFEVPNTPEFLKLWVLSGPQESSTIIVKNQVWLISLMLVSHNRPKNWVLQHFILKGVVCFENFLFGLSCLQNNGCDFFQTYPEPCYLFGRVKKQVLQCKMQSFSINFSRSRPFSSEFLEIQLQYLKSDSIEVSR